MVLNALGVDGWVSLSGYSGLSAGFSAQSGPESSLPCGRQALVLPASLKMDYLGPGYP